MTDLGLSGFYIMGDIMMRALRRFAVPVLAIPRPVKRGFVLTLYLRLGTFMPMSGPPIWPALVASVNSAIKSAGASKSGKPCDRLIAPCCCASADITEKIVVPTWGSREEIGRVKLGMRASITVCPTSLCDMRAPGGLATDALVR